ncbi:unnamed protein product [Xylocopa violacea]|uniref:Uncharacterized protein n=1 Tax=Xylocopa violacea TaxID=135666 RepID=A0ABP1N6J9_XYLVO
MQTPSDSAPQSPILPLISVCLLAVLAWNLFLVWSSVSWLLSIRESFASRKRLERIGLDRPRAAAASSRAGLQFSASSTPENERNYASFVPVFNQKIDFNPAKSLLEDFHRGIFLTNSTSNYEHSRNNSATSTEMIEASADSRMENHANRKPNDGSVDHSANSDVTFIEEPSNAEEMSLNKETISEIESSSNFMHRPEERSSVEAVMKNVTVDPVDGRYAEEEFDREADGWNNSGADSSHKFPANFEDGTDDERSGGRATDFGTKIEKRAETTASRFLARKLLALLLEESSAFRINSRELLRGIDPEKEADHSSKERVAKEEQVDRDDATVNDKSAEFLTRAATDKDNEIRPLEEDDYPDEQFGVVPEVGANCTEEKSVIHSSKNATQSRSGMLEAEDGVGPPPETSCLKNGRGAESTISFGPAAASGHGKEEEDLNAIIRRMIIVELKRHRKKERTVLKRAQSESVLSRKKRNDANRTGLFDAKGRTLFRDLLELEESVRKNAENASDGEDFAKQVEDRSTNEAEVKVAVDRARDSIGSMAIAFKGNSNIQLERKVNASCLRDAGAGRSIQVEEASTIHRQTESNKSTQTERVYVIQAARSCPLRKQRLPLYFQMHRVASGRDAVCSKTVFASLDLSKFIFRKASDNLIYEKGKGSRSPSYLPVPERHRWKYVTPNRIE